ncbi:hypothetical protein ACLEPN_28470 [Myxococcus sp. 1LA]
MTGAPLFALLALVSTQYDGSSTVEEVSSEEEVSAPAREGAPSPPRGWMSPRLRAARTRAVGASASAASWRSVA